MNRIKIIVMAIMALSVVSISQASECCKSKKQNLDAVVDISQDENVVAIPNNNVAGNNNAAAHLAPAAQDASDVEELPGEIAPPDRLAAGIHSSGGVTPEEPITPVSSRSRISRSSLHHAPPVSSMPSSPNLLGALSQPQAHVTRIHGSIEQIAITAGVVNIYVRSNSRSSSSNHSSPRVDKDKGDSKRRQSTNNRPSSSAATSNSPAKPKVAFADDGKNNAK